MTELDYKKVLVAESSSIIQGLLKKVLLFENCEASPAKDGQAALDKFEAEDFELVIVDMNLPGISGLEVTRKIRAMKKKKAKVPIIGISGNPKNLPVASFFEAGMDEYMQKPLDYDKLIRLVKKHVGEDS